MTKPNMWRRIPEDYREARKLTFPNREEIAQWCGGMIKEESKSSDPTDISIELLLPNVTGNQRAHIGNYIVRDSNGRFNVVKASEWLAEYEEIQPAKRGGVITSDDVPKASGGIVVTMNSGDVTQSARGMSQFPSGFPGVINTLLNRK